jgi:membrane AbrB-like protein
VPRPLVDAAQVIIGCALGSRFRRELLRDARVLLPSLALAVTQGMALLAAVAVAIATASDRPASTLLLATAPGGIAELCLTARTLRLGVPLVSAFHVVRMVLLLTCAPAAYRLWCVVDPPPTHGADPSP